MVLSACAQEDNRINTVPMYGQIKKSRELLNADEKFLSQCDKLFQDRQTAAKYYAARGWDFFHKKDYTTSIKRFNQAWLLDSTNATAYWGMAVIMAKRHEFQESIPLFQRALKLNQNQPALWEDAATAYLNSFTQSDKRGQLDTGINYMKIAISLDTVPKSARLATLITAYSFSNIDSARVYYHMLNGVDTALVNEEVRQKISRIAN